MGSALPLLFGKSTVLPFSFPTLKMWNDGADASSYTHAYQNLSQTGTGSIGGTSITASAAVDSIVQPGEILRIGGTDKYTIATVSGTAIGIVGTLSANYTTAAIALDKVSQWNDKSGNNNHLTQATASKQAVINPTKLNNKGVMHFNGAAVYNAPSSLYTIPQGDNTCVVIANRLTETGGAQEIIFAGNAGSFIYYLTFDGVAGDLRFRNQISGGAKVVATGGTNTNFQILTGKLTGTQELAGIGRTITATDTNGVYATAIDTFLVGGASGGSEMLVGNIAEIMIWGSALSSAQLSSLYNNYIKPKWGV